MLRPINDVTSGFDVTIGKGKKNRERHEPAVGNE